MSKQERKTAAKAISDSAQKIWLAGLGAFSKAQAEGSRLFDELMRDGEALEQQTRKYTKERVGQLRDRMEETADRLRKTGQSSMERIQTLVDERVAKAVERLAMPTREDINELATRMTQLNRRVMGEVERTSKEAMSAVRKTAGTTRPATSKAPRRAATKTSTRSRTGAAGKTAAQKSAAAKGVGKKATKSSASRGASTTAKRGPGKKAAKPAVKKSVAKKATARRSAR
jgi:poly(hydroxyalkanoate) granule-associated protein